MRKFITPVVLYVLAFLALFLGIYYAWIAETYTPRPDFYINLSSFFGYSFYVLFLLATAFLIRYFIGRRKK
ncbi:hypothetical protein [Cellvibrio mixtus]|uniref:hypothetical protein n=1 Tax=Cellvibrio mixtus TaxID=39650 RepID=UPI000AAA39CC|nr:hypothetical protein [Cellvibrio mixtus]